TQGMNLLNQLEANSFAALVMRNTDLGQPGQAHLPGDLFNTPDHILEIVKSVQVGDDPTHANPILNIIKPLFIRRDVDGDGDDDFLQYNGGAHVVLGGSEEADTLIGGLGIDTLWGDGGNDRLDGGYEADKVHGGDGDDIITNLGGDDFLFGEEGNDVISMGSGVVLGFGGRGKDFIMTGPDTQEVFAGEGDDFILGGNGSDTLLGNEGDDWIEGGEGFDGLAGENSELFFNSPIIGHDVLNGQGNDTDYDGESGDDIMVQGAGIQRNNGMFGFDWAIHKGDNVAANSDLGIPFFPGAPEFTLRDRFDSVEGLSGWNLDDTLSGQSKLVLGARPGTPADQDHLKAGNVHLIDGLAELLGYTQAEVDAMDPNTSLVVTNLGAETGTGGGEIIIGGGGSDTIKGNLSNDILDGDAWLNVRIAVSGVNGLTSIDSLNEIKARMLSGEINPSQLSIVREILYSTTAATDIDTAVYNGNQADYTITYNANGSIIVAHTNVVAGVIDDGVDTIRNFERLQFADSVLDLSNGAPVITSDGGGDVAAVNFAENDLATVTTVAATDANPSDTLVYAIIGGADAGLFEIDSATGALTFVSAPNFEAATDAGLDNVYDVVVEVSDGIATDTQALAVTVTNVNEAGTGGVSIVGYTTNAASATLQASSSFADPDGIVSSVPYQWQRLVAGNWQNIAGATNATLANQVNTTVRVTSSYTDQFGTNSFTSNETAFITANNGNNIVAGSNGNDYVLGLGGIDTLTGGAGNDIVDGGTGNDRLVASIGDGNDTYIGGFGTDTYDLSATTADTTINIALGTSTSTQTGNDTLSGIENIVGSQGNNIIYDGAGPNRLDGNAGNDTFILRADVASDVILGGTGIDTVDYSALTANLTVTLNGVNPVTVNGTGSGVFGLNNRDQIRQIENFIGGSGNDNITGDGLANALSGGFGNDTLRGGQGADVLTGGAGNDVFDFNANNQATGDQITDFQGAGVAGGDIIDLAGFAGTFSFIGTLAFDANGTNQLRYELDGLGNTVVQIDTNGVIGFESSILLVGVTSALIASDFVL
ncbi:MAG: hypothetical protein ABL859_08360, partial [Methylotenera sp.]